LGRRSAGGGQTGGRTDLDQRWEEGEKRGLLKGEKDNRLAIRQESARPRKKEPEIIRLFGKPGRMNWNPKEKTSQSEAHRPLVAGGAGFH